MDSIVSIIIDTALYILKLLRMQILEVLNTRKNLRGKECFVNLL